MKKVLKGTGFWSGHLGGWCPPSVVKHSGDDSLTSFNPVFFVVKFNINFIFNFYVVILFTFYVLLWLCSPGLVIALQSRLVLTLWHFSCLGLLTAGFQACTPGTASFAFPLCVSGWGWMCPPSCCCSVHWVCVCWAVSL